ncbi:hypothetical protein GCM10023194_43680 [Planotetraspora phitsanulokensis]|uniref:Uncharacterized protein n=1 Tax=Planotetraspora phitsanulokensis TaxID=575192 RepID=A0A8J3XEC7_9ACTN|nr:hypothetical protein [Planotetraspora phitsanulokensis]GII37970.1 hypothetical protein Pph01_29730 [Planotetraspora phitsanulokensis]
MAFDDETPRDSEALDEVQLPRHLVALVGALQGPSDLGARHNHYLTYPHHEEPGGAATA